MAKSNETIIVEACSIGDITTLRSLLDKNIKLGNKSRAKGFYTLFDRALDTALTAKKNKVETIDLLCQLAGNDLEKLLSEDTVISIANKYRFDVLDSFIKYGYSFDKPSKDNRYITVYDRLFRQSISYARIEVLEYLIPKINLNWIDLSKLIPFLVENEDIVTIVESRLQDKIDGFSCLLAVLYEHGLNPMDIAAILA